MGRKRKSKRKSRRVQWLEDDIVVWSYRKAKKCWECGRAFEARRSLVVFQGSKKWSRATCIECMRLDTLAFLPSGSSKLTRRASKYSSVRAVVVRNRRKFVQRFGILVEPEAILRACDECEVPVPEGCREPIAGTEVTLPPRTLVSSQHDEDQADTAPETENSDGEGESSDESKEAGERVAASTESKPGRDTIRSISRSIREAYPDCCPKRARAVARFAVQNGVPGVEPGEVLTPADVGALVSKYLRRRRVC